MMQSGGIFSSLGSMGALAPILLFFVALYFLMIVPNQRKQKAWQEMLGGLKSGDKVTTSGGIRGTVIAGQGRCRDPADSAGRREDGVRQKRDLGRDHAGREGLRAARTSEQDALFYRLARSGTDDDAWSTLVSSRVTVEADVLLAAGGASGS